MFKPGIMRIIWIITMGLMIPGAAWALPVDTEQTDASEGWPLVIVAVDKMDSLELLSCNLPGVQKLLTEGACGLMNIRSGKGYTDSASGYLTLGTGSRSTMPGLSGSTYKIGNGRLPGGNAGSYLQWSLGGMAGTLGRENLVVPEIGWIKNQARLADYQVNPGRLGAVFHENGWRTCLIGNLDNITTLYRPGGLLLMDRRGVIDEGQISKSIHWIEPGFPYRYRFSTDKVMDELSVRLASRKIILVEFGDFFRLDAYREEMKLARYEVLKQNIWLSFDYFLTRLFRLRAEKRFTLVVVSPSVAGEGFIKKNLLGIFVINDPGYYHSGLLTSGTTKWPGLVANIDFLPTLLKVTNLQSKQRLSGRPVTVIPDKNNRQRLTVLSQRLIANNLNQRRVLDWSMGVIAFGWIAGLLGIYMARVCFENRRLGSYLGLMGDWLITFVAIIPLSLFLLPIFPIVFWQVGGFLALSMVISILFIQIKTVNRRILVLSGLIWAGLILDQLLGWHLIRFSPLGYSAMAGSRYYGIGNEFMGAFLAAALILTHLISQNNTAKWWTPKWMGPFILGLSVLVFSLPQLGAKFGGILSGTAGFSYYLIKVYNVKFNNRKLWLILGGCIIGLAAIGWWDSLRAPEVQTHIGRFVRLFLNRDFAQVGEIIVRKLAMNLKLTVFSPWMRIILLTLILGIIHRVVAKSKLAQPEDTVLWKSILVTGLAAYMVNDAGVLAFATCLVYGFSFVLLKFGERSLGTKEVS